MCVWPFGASGLWLRYAALQILPSGNLALGHAINRGRISQGVSEASFFLVLHSDWTDGKNFGMRDVMGEKERKSSKSFALSPSAPSRLLSTNDSVSEKQFFSRFARRQNFLAVVFPLDVIFEEAVGGG